MNNYYTYAYLREDGTPYYIGKGKNKRVYVKARTVPLPIDKSKIIFLKKNLTEEQALKHEEYMIFIFGRKDLGTGILRNRCEGGKGTPKRVISEEEREQMRKREIGNKRFLGKKHTDETKEKISTKNKGRKWTVEQKEKLKNRKPKPLVDNPSQHTLYMREWREKNREKCREYQLKHKNNKH